MPLFGKSFLDVETLPQEAVFSIFQKAKKIRQYTQALQKSTVENNKKVLGFMFLEPSTRTRSSFQMAAHKIGVKVLHLEPTQSSLSKGESVEDTALTLQALGVSAIVLRHESPSIVDRISSVLKIPIINAGDGTRGHPTQALLDAFTIHEERGQIEGERVLIVGDIKYSRVARSNVSLLKKLGAKVAVCGPSTLRQNHYEGIEEFSNIEEGLAWASVCMLLRMQSERQAGFEVPSLKEFSRRFGVNHGRLKKFKTDGIILHPGPFNRGVELHEEILSDPRCRIFKQVENGVLTRAALLSEILGVEEL